MIAGSVHNRVGRKVRYLLPKPTPTPGPDPYDKPVTAKATEQDGGTVRVDYT